MVSESNERKRDTMLAIKYDFLNNTPLDRADDKVYDRLAMMMEQTGQLDCASLKDFATAAQSHEGLSVSLWLNDVHDDLSHIQVLPLIYGDFAGTKTVLLVETDNDPFWKSVREVMVANVDADKHTVLDVLDPQRFRELLIG